LVKSRGNSYWGKAGPLPAASPSSFEEMVRAMKLHPAEYEQSHALKDWVWRNKDHKYVPLELLKAWGFDVKDES
jgi:hypothetical protein